MNSLLEFFSDNITDFEKKSKFLFIVEIPIENHIIERTPDFLVQESLHVKLMETYLNNFHVDVIKIKLFQLNNFLINSNFHK